MKFDYEIKLVEKVDKTKFTCEIPGCEGAAHFRVWVNSTEMQENGFPYYFCLWHKIHALEYHQELMEIESKIDHYEKEGEVEIYEN